MKVFVGLFLVVFLTAVRSARRGSPQRRMPLLLLCALVTIASLSYRVVVGS